MVQKLIEIVIGFWSALMTYMTSVVAESAKLDFTGTYETIWEIVGHTSETIFVPIGSLFVVIYFFITISDKVSFEQLSFEQTMKEIIRLVAGLYLVQNTGTIITGCIGIGNSLTDKVQKYIETKNLDGIDMTAQFPTTFEAAIKDLSSGQIVPLVALLMVAFFLIFLLFLLLAFLVIKIVCIARNIEVCIKATLAPLALCDTFNGNIMQSHAMAFIRSFLAICLQGVLITIALNMLPLFMNDVLSKFVGSMNIFTLILKIVEMLAFSIALLIFILKSGSVSKEIMGAR